VSVPKDGYRWWYLDALSDDQRHGLTIIGFVGSVFSPYYASARRRGEGDPENFCALNVALYGQKKRWAMTERGRGSVTRSADEFTVGPSRMRWEEGALVIDIDEWCVPIPHRLKGRVRLSPGIVYDNPVTLDAAGLHTWRAVAPFARVEAEFEAPEVEWSGSAYHDMNWGAEPLERAFHGWTWSRAPDADATLVFYDAQRKDGTEKNAALKFRDGAVEEIAAPPQSKLSRGLWGMPRLARSSSKPRLIATLEDAPFYTRSHIGMNVEGRALSAIHESLSLDRFDTAIVQKMLPFRMPRRG
jgi:carotenoid 1,2-hydratase